MSNVDPSISFEIVAREPSGRARAGIIHTPHGDIPTPCFAPVGTLAAVKAMSPRDLKEVGATLILANAYHLAMRPGAGLVARMGGLHRFMGWDGPILTDSGGFQVFSLTDLRDISDDGVRFRSHIDGAEHFFSPERVMEIEEQLGADIIMPLDVCTAYGTDYEQTRIDMQRTHRWAERCLAAHSRLDQALRRGSGQALRRGSGQALRRGSGQALRRGSGQALRRGSGQALYGIVQGGFFADLRAESAEFIAGLDFPGYAVGGLSVGEPKAEMWAMLDVVVSRLPGDRPRHLLGVGTVDDLIAGVAAGIDTFDCVYPTRLARNTSAMLRSGERLNLRNARFTDDPQPIDLACECYACRRFSRAYIRHLIKADEILGLHLLTLHNLRTVIRLMEEVREAIVKGEFAELRVDVMRRA